MRTSVVIPTYHRLDRLVAAVESVSHQTLAADELIVVAADPAELDAITALLAQHYVGNSKVVSGNRKLLGGAARNLGWQSATGDVILFLDDDDYFARSKLASHLRAHAFSDIDIVYSGVWLVFDSNDMREQPPSVPGPDMALSLTVDGICPPTTSCVSVRRQPLEAAGGFDEALPSYQDWELWYRLSKNGCRFSTINEPLTYFVQHDQARVSMNVTGRLSAATMIIEKHGPSVKLNRFFDREKRHTADRAVTIAARRGELAALVTWARFTKDGTYSLFAIRTYVTLAKACALLSIHLFRVP